MKEYDSVEYPNDLYNNMYGQIQYEILESIKSAINKFNSIDPVAKEDLIKEIEEQIEKEKNETKKMIELTNFQYNIKEERRRKTQEKNHIKSYYLDYDYGFKPVFKEYLY